MKSIISLWSCYSMIFDEIASSFAAVSTCSVEVIELPFGAFSFFFYIIFSSSFRLLANTSCSQPLYTHWSSMSSWWCSCSWIRRLTETIMMESRQLRHPAQRSVIRLRIYGVTFLMYLLVKAFSCRCHRWYPFSRYVDEISLAFGVLSMISLISTITTYKFIEFAVGPVMGILLMCILFIKIFIYVCVYVRTDTIFHI